MSIAKITKRHFLSNAILVAKHRYAEAWLDHAVELYRPIFEAGGHAIPPVILSVGFAHDGYKPIRKRNAVAICYARQCSADSMNQIIVTPLRTEPLDLLWLLGHELIHAVDDCVHGHGPVFDKIAESVGYWPNKKASLIDAKKFDKTMAMMAQELGRYPRAPFLFNE